MGDDPKVEIKTEHDLDRLEVGLLFLVEHPNQMHATTSFLNRRGWKTLITKDPGQAVQILTKESIDFVLISVNHPNPKVSQMFRLIPQTFNKTTIAIAEKADAKSIGLLNQAPAAEKLLGRISGPAIYRKIRIILGARHGLNVERERGAPERSGDIYSPVADGQESSEVKNEGSPYIRFKRESAESGYIKVTQTEGAEGNFEREGPSGKLASGLEVAVQEGSQAEKFFAIQEGAKAAAVKVSKASKVTPPMEDEGSESTAEIFSARSNTEGSSTNHSAINAPASSSGKSITLGATKNAIARIDKKIWIKDSESRDTFAVVSEALEKISDPNHVEQVNRLSDQIKTFGVIPIAIENRDYFLVFAHSGNSEVLEGRLFDYYSELSQSKNAAEAGYVLAAPFVFSENHIHFEKLIHMFGAAVFFETDHDNEMAAGVIKRNPDPIFEAFALASEENPRVAFPVEFLRAQAPIQFDLFLKLTPTLRIIKYVKSGREISAKQIENLQKNQAELLVSYSEIEEVKRHVMSAEIRQMILALKKDQAA